MKSLLVGGEVFHGDGRTDRHDARNSRNFLKNIAKVTKKEEMLTEICVLNSCYVTVTFSPGQNSVHIFFKYPCCGVI